MVKPIAIALDKLQSNKTKIGDAVSIFKSLALDLENVLTTSNDKDIFKKRYKMALSPVHFAAFMLDPKWVYFKFWLNSFEVHRGQFFRKFRDVVDEIPRPDWTVSEVVIRDGQRKHHKLQMVDIYEIIRQIWTAGFGIDWTAFDCNCINSVNRERVFSKFGIVHSKLRNRLG